ncbi:TolC family protein [Pontibacter sp. G13]|uniref:TolC family protein n=1 Tax=Pontibacter sp. G13 TaxID=3074898 RepID=UPI00288C033A|nr:TolC family protein [Pontibacter sp. G13]WNJ19889.1 TolC family protein [Pontibacter sp. G13]
MKFTSLVFACCQILTIWLCPRLWAQQVLDLPTALSRASSTHPYAQQGALHRELSESEATAIRKARLPQAMIQGQIAYFSDVISPADENSPAALVFPDIPFLQGQAYLQVNYDLYNGNIRNKKLIQNDASLDVSLADTEVKLFEIKQQVLDLYVAAAILEAQMGIYQQDLIPQIDSQLQEMIAQEAEGAALPGQTDAIRLEFQRTQQQIVQLASTRDGLLQTLAVWLDAPEEWANWSLQPPAQLVDTRSEIDRPELSLFRAQGTQLATSDGLLESRRMPIVSVYGIGGFGVPNPYNFLEVNGDFFGQIGLRVQWKPWDYGEVRAKRQSLEVQQSILQQQEEAFKRGLDAQIARTASAIEQAQKLVEQDDQIIQILERNAKRSKAQLEIGVVTTSQHIDALKALTQAKFTRITHQWDIIKQQYYLAIAKGHL